MEAMSSRAWQLAKEMCEIVHAEDLMKQRLADCANAAATRSESFMEQEQPGVRAPPAAPRTAKPRS